MQIALMGELICIIYKLGVSTVKMQFSQNFVSATLTSSYGPYFGNET